MQASRPPDGLTRQLASFVASASTLAVRDDVVRIVKNGFIDTAATTLAGRDEPVVRALLRLLDRRSPDARHTAEANLLYGSTLTSARDAALVNAAAGHALDYDDVGLCGHPSTVLVPVLLAEGQRLHASGAALIRAYVVGYEVWAELIRRDADLHHAKGWHPTAVFGVLACAAAVGALRGVDVDHAQHALAIAASMAGGLVANFGSMVKPFHAGQAAAEGLDAVDLAEAGLTGSPDAIEHPSGFLAALSPRGEVDRSPCAVPLGTRLRIRESGLTVKKYPMCFATHRVIDAVLTLVREHDVRSDDIAEVQVEIGPAQASMLRNHAPCSGLEAKFSLEFAVAAAVVARAVGLAQLEPSFVVRADVQALFATVRTAVRHTVCPSEPSLAESDRVVVRLRDGRMLDSGDVFFATGTPQSPLGPEELRSKFADCAALARDVDGARLFERLDRLETLADVSTLLG